MHYFVWNSDFGEPEIGKLYITDLFSFRILVNEYILWLEITMNNSTLIEVTNGRYDLVHADGNLSFLELVSLNMIKKLTT